MKICSVCGGRRIYRFEYDPDRGGVPRLFNLINDLGIEKEWDKHRFHLDGHVCRDCGSINKTYNMPDTDNLSENELDYRLIKICQYMKDKLEGDYIDNYDVDMLLGHLHKIIAKFDVSDFYGQILALTEIADIYTEKESEREYFKIVKSQLEDIINEGDK